MQIPISKISFSISMMKETQKYFYIVIWSQQHTVVVLP